MGEFRLVFLGHMMQRLNQICPALLTFKLFFYFYFFHLYYYFFLLERLRQSFTLAHMYGEGFNFVTHAHKHLSVTASVATKMKMVTTECAGEGRPCAEQDEKCVCVCPHGRAPL